MLCCSRRLCLGLLWWGLAAAACANTQALPPQVEAALTQGKLPRDAVVFLVQPVESAAPARLAHRVDSPVKPASVAKLVTTFASLDLLGPSFTWTTPVYLEGEVRDGTLHGNLYIKGQGDPKLVVERLWLLLRRIQGLGIHHVTGDIVLDRSAFEIAAMDPAAFDGEPLRPYNAAPDALLLNFKSVVMTFSPTANGATARVHVEPPLAASKWPASVPLSSGECADWRAALKLNLNDPYRVGFDGAYPSACGEQTWPLAHPDPGSYAVRAVAGMWRQLECTVGGQVREGRVPSGLAPAFEWRSVTLAEVVHDVNKFSNNVMAQQLFLTLSLQQRGVGTIQGSREVLQSWWRSRVGGEPPVLDNGSGLSRDERITAQQLGQLLRTAWASPLMPELMSSLPVMGRDGTLRRAQRNVGIAHMKTGSLRDVAGVAGYVLGASGRRYIVVAIANHANALALRPAVDALVEWTAQDQ